MAQLNPNVTAVSPSDLPPLNIRTVRTTAVSVPMARPLGTSAQTVRNAPLLLVDLETQQGITGRTYLWCYMPVGAALISQVIKQCVEFIAGDAVVPCDVAGKLARRFCLIGATGIVSMALAGIDVACWDALASAAGMPLYQFLGGVSRPIPAYNSNGLGLIPPEAAADEAEELLDGGFRAVKQRLGHLEAPADLAAARAVRKRLPDDVTLMIDYNQALSVDEALRRGRALDSEGMAWLEEPIQHDNYEGCGRISRELVTPIQIGENFAGPNAMSAALSARAADYFMADVFRIGGVSGWLEAASLASNAGIKLSSHLMPEVSAHLLTVSPTAHWLEYVDWACPILAEPFPVVQGTLAPPNRPGTGLMWNQEAVARYRMA
jgi:mandelate racemase